MSHRFAILDVDDVILDMDRLAESAIASVYAPLAEVLGAAVAERVTRDFGAGYETLRTQLRSNAGERFEDFAALSSCIQAWQRGVLEAGHELKIWSREALMAVALDKHGVAPTSALVHGAVDHYWRVLTDETRMLPDAIRLVARLKAEGTWVHLATNSDGFLTFDDAENTLTYDPSESAAKKVARLAKISELGLCAENLTVGDPIGKPKDAYYDAVLRDFARVAGEPIELSETLVIGDSITNDVLPLMARGAPHGAWILRKHAAPGPERVPEHPGVVRVKSLNELEGVKWD